MSADVLTLPAAVHGTVAGPSQAEIKFKGQAKQSVLIEIEAQRLGSKLRPIVHLYDANKTQLAWNWGKPTLQGDARLQALLPADGIYSVTVHDAEYAAQGGSFFRLKIGTWSYVDQVFPPVINSGKTPGVLLMGSADFLAQTPPASKDPLGSHRPVAWPTKETWSGPRPFVTFSTLPEIRATPVASAEADPKDKKGPVSQELPKGTVAVTGKLLKPYQEARFRVPVTPGKKLRVEAFAERLGSPMDVALIVRNAAGGQLARVEDGSETLDPTLEYAVPAKVDHVLVCVFDAQGRGGPRGIYRLVINPESSASKAGFTLTTDSQTHTLLAGQRLIVPVYVERNGTPGIIEVTGNMPRGVRLTGGQIPDGANGTLLTLQRDTSPFAAAVVGWVGKSAAGDLEPVIFGKHPLKDLQPWLATQIAVAPGAEKIEEFTIDWDASKPELVAGAKKELAFKIKRADPKDTVRVSLLTSQPEQLVNGRPDANRTLRLEKAVTVPAKGVAGKFTLLAPPSLESKSYEMALRAELVKPGNKVAAVAYSPVLQFPVAEPFAVKFAAGSRIEADLVDKKPTTVNIQGKIERADGLPVDVQLAVTGLPAGARANAVTLKPKEDKFSIDLVLPANIKAGEVKGIQLTASALPVIRIGGTRISSSPVDVTLVLKDAPAKPDPKKTPAKTPAKKTPAKKK